MWYDGGMNSTECYFLCCNDLGTPNPTSQPNIYRHFKKKYLPFPVSLILLTLVIANGTQTYTIDVYTIIHRHDSPLHLPMY